MIAPLGSGERHLANLLTKAQNLAWSPDGRWLVSTDREQPDQPGGLVLLSVETGEKRRLTRPPADGVDDTAASFSPDGRFLAFGRTGPSYSGLAILELSPEGVPKGEVRRLTENQLLNSTCWMPDGREILYTTTGEGSGELWRQTLDGSSGPERVTFVGEQSRDVTLAAPRRDRPGSSPHLAFARLRRDSNIWSFETPQPGRRAQPLPLIALTRNEEEPELSPDGRKIVYVSDRSGSFQIWVCDVDGSHAVQLTDWKGRAPILPHWSPDSRQVVYSFLGGVRGLQVVPADGGRSRPIRTKVEAADSNWWSRDGKSIYFTSHAPSTAGLWKIALDSGQEQRLSWRETHAGAESPDGREFYFFHDGWIWKIPSAGGKETKLVRAAANSLAMTAKGFYFEAERAAEGHTPIHFFRFDTGAVEPIVMTAKRGLRGLSAALDGRHIIYSQLESEGSDLMLIKNFR